MTRFFGWCECGWESPLFDDSDLAWLLAGEHEFAESDGHDPQVRWLPDARNCVLDPERRTA